jgi:hypothetical protein
MAPSAAMVDFLGFRLVYGGEIIRRSGPAGRRLPSGLLAMARSRQPDHGAMERATAGPVVAGVQEAPEFLLRAS